MACYFLFSMTWTPYTDQHPWLEQSVFLNIWSLSGPDSTSARTDLWRRSQIYDAIQLNPAAELLHEEGVPVLIDGPLGGVHAAQLKHVQSEDVPEEEDQHI